MVGLKVGSIFRLLGRGVGGTVVGLDVRIVGVAVGDPVGAGHCVAVVD